MPNQGKLLKIYLDFVFCLCTLNYFLLIKSLPWPLDIHGSKLSFYLNIVRKTFMCDVGLSENKSMVQ